MFHWSLDSGQPLLTSSASPRPIVARISPARCARLLSFVGISRRSKPIEASKAELTDASEAEPFAAPRTTSSEAVEREPIKTPNSRPIALPVVALIEASKQKSIEESINALLADPISAPLAEPTEAVKQKLTKAPSSEAINAPRREAPTLRTLPAELRNCIFELVLIQDPEAVDPRLGIQIIIEVNKDLRVPPLLQTCEQIRKEASGLYYYGNCFGVNAPDYDGTIFAKFERLCLSALESVAVEWPPPTANVLLCIIGKHWGNVTKWSQMVWAREAQPLERNILQSSAMTTT